MEYNNTFYGDAYCVKCKEKVEFEGQVRTADSGRRMAFGICPKCGTKVNRILGGRPNEPAPTIVPPVVPQPAVSIPMYRTYATVDVWQGNWGLWYARVVDHRRIPEDKIAHTSSLSRRGVMRQVDRWLSAWSRKEYKERI